MMVLKIVYKGVQLFISLAGFFILGWIGLGNVPADVEAGINPDMIKYLFGGLALSLLFALISAGVGAGIGMVFKNSLSYSRKYIQHFFFGQWIIFSMVYVLLFLFTAVP